MLAQARPVRARAQGQQVAVQQEAVPVRGAQAERGRPQCQPPEEERLARVARLQPRLERRQRERENEHHGERHHGEGKVHRAGVRGMKGCAAILQPTAAKFLAPCSFSLASRMYCCCRCRCFSSCYCSRWCWTINS